MESQIKHINKSSLSELKFKMITNPKYNLNQNNILMEKLKASNLWQKNSKQGSQNRNL